MSNLFQIISILAMVLLHSEVGFADPAPSQPSCVRVSQGSRSFSQTSFNFFNGCGQRLFINACVSDRFGDPKLYRSGRSIQAGGRFSINTLPGMSPASMQWIAGPIDPGAPPLCGKKA